jgi:hypothetical protein
LVKDLLERQSPITDVTDKLIQMEQAAQALLFVTDLRGTISAFAKVDTKVDRLIQ